jgi:hypothetical protein
MLAKLNELSNKQHVHPDLVAGVYAGLGQKDNDLAQRLDHMRDKSTRNLAS